MEGGQGWGGWQDNTGGTTRQVAATTATGTIFTRPGNDGGNGSGGDNDDGDGDSNSGDVTA